MKRLLFTITLVSIFVLYVQAQTNTRRDGNWWNEKERVEKYIYVTGFFDGMDLGHQFGYWGLIDHSKDDDHQSPCLKKTMDSYGSYSDKFFTSVTSSQIADGLDEFYKDYRNQSEPKC